MIGLRKGSSGRVHGNLGVMLQIGLLAGPFMSMIDSSVVNVALPDIAKALNGTLATVQWVASAYLLVLGMTLTSTAYLAKRFGTRRVYVTSLIGFTVTSALCALAPTVELLIGARMLQAVFGAPLVPLAMNMLLGRDGQQSRLPAAAGMVLFLAPAVGPSLGGALIHWAGWPTIFLVNVPVGLFAILGAQGLADQGLAGGDGAPRLDWPGFILLASGLGLLTYGASQGAQSGWISAASWPYWAAGVPLLAGYNFWAMRRTHPIVDIALLRRAQDALGLAVTAIVAVVTFAVIVLVPTFVQEVQGNSAMAAGIALLPQGLLTGVGMLLGNILPVRIGVRRTAVAGMLALTLSTTGMLFVQTASPDWLMALILCGRGLSVGLVIQPLLNRLIGGQPPETLPDANTFFNVVQRVGGTLGIALIVTFFQVRERLRIKTVLKHFGMPAGQSNTTHLAATALPAAVHRALSAAATAGFHDVIWLVAGISALGLVLSLGISNTGEPEPGTLSTA